MKNNFRNIETIIVDRLKSLEQSHVPKDEVPTWDSFKPRVIKFNFYKWSPNNFNIYYVSSIALLLLILLYFNLDYLQISNSYIEQKENLSASEEIATDSIKKVTNKNREINTNTKKVTKPQNISTQDIIIAVPDTTKNLSIKTITDLPILNSVDEIKKENNTKTPILDTTLIKQEAHDKQKILIEIKKSNKIVKTDTTIKKKSKKFFD